MKRKWEDFKVRKLENDVRGELYAIYLAKKILVATYPDEKVAIEMCKNLNDDPWYFEKKDWAAYKQARISYTPPRDY